jgi:hypothetical protein
MVHALHFTCALAAYFTFSTLFQNNVLMYIIKVPGDSYLHAAAVITFTTIAMRNM